MSYNVVILMLYSLPDRIIHRGFHFFLDESQSCEHHGESRFGDWPMSITTHLCNRCIVSCAACTRSAGASGYECGILKH